MLPNCGGEAADDPNVAGALVICCGVVKLNESAAGLAAALKLKAGEAPPNEGGAVKAEFALSAGFAPKIPDD